MLFFKRILKESKPAANAGPVVERRSTKRYAINPHFPIKAVLSFVPRDDTGAPISHSRHGWNWKSTLVDCSEQGARLRMESTLKVEARDLCDLILQIDDFELTLPCHIANIAESAEGVMFGLKHDIMDDATRVGYGQLLEILALGSTLRLHSKTTEPDKSGYLVEHYTSNRPARLSLWRHPANEAVAAFEFQLKDNLVRAAAGQGLQYLVGTPARTAQAAQAMEIQRLFNWVLPNLAAAVPEDVREFLQHYAT